MAKLLAIADLPTLEEKILSQAKQWLNQSQKTKLLQSETHKCYHCLLLARNLSRCAGKWLLHRFIKVFSSRTILCFYGTHPHFRHTLDRTQNYPHKAALLHCIPAAGIERTDLCKMLKDPSTEKQTWKGLRFSIPLSGGVVCHASIRCWYFHTSCLAKDA